MGQLLVGDIVGLHLLNPVGAVVLRKYLIAHSHRLPDALVGLRDAVKPGILRQIRALEDVPADPGPHLVVLRHGEVDPLAVPTAVAGEQRTVAVEMGPRVFPPVLRAEQAVAEDENSRLVQRHADTVTLPGALGL